MSRFKYRILPAVILLLFIMGIFTVQDIGAETYFELGKRLLKEGCEGPDVALLQRKLKDMGFYKGPIDGLYGKLTVTGVKRFQRHNNITVDGITGPETYDYLPKDRLMSRMDISRDDIILLARIINGEARGETFKGKVGVGAVVLNRVYSNNYPDSIREVILQEGQFSSLRDGQANLYPLQSSIDAARSALIGYDPTYSSIFFYNPEVATNLEWISSRPVTTKIGDHVFAR